MVQNDGTKPVSIVVCLRVVHRIESKLNHVLSGFGSGGLRLTQRSKILPLL